MPIGMMWFDKNKDTTVAQKIVEAQAYYTTKYGIIPTHVMMHPALAVSGVPEVSLQVILSRGIIPNNYFIYKDNDERNHRYLESVRTVPSKLSDNAPKTAEA